LDREHTHNINQQARQSEKGEGEVLNKGHIVQPYPHTYNNTHHNTKAKVFNSEYAVTSDAGHGNLIAAIGEAAWMTGLERNGDVVSTASYAPLFVNDNDRHWNPDAIVFNSYQTYGTPSYWNQVLFSNSFTGIVGGSVKTLTNTLSSPNTAVSVTIGNSQMPRTVVIVHKVVNYGATALDLSISITGIPSTAKFNPVLDVTTIGGGSKTDENTFAAPRNIAPKSSQLTVSGPSFTATFPAYSITVVRAYATL